MKVESRGVMLPRLFHCDFILDMFSRITYD